MIPSRILKKIESAFDDVINLIEKYNEKNNEKNNEKVSFTEHHNETHLTNKLDDHRMNIVRNNEQNMNFLHSLVKSDNDRNIDIFHIQQEPIIYETQEYYNQIMDQMYQLYYSELNYFRVDIPIFYKMVFPRRRGDSAKKAFDALSSGSNHQILPAEFDFNKLYTQEEELRTDKAVTRKLIFQLIKQVYKNIYSEFHLFLAENQIMIPKKNYDQYDLWIYIKKFIRMGEDFIKEFDDITVSLLFRIHQSFIMC